MRQTADNKTQSYNHGDRQQRGRWAPKVAPEMSLVVDRNLGIVKQEQHSNRDVITNRVYTGWKGKRRRKSENLEND